MKLIRTAKIKLDIPTSEVLPTIQAYTKAFNFVCKTGFSLKEFNGINLHKKTYREVKEYLPAQLTISARMKATEALKGIKKNKYPKCPQSKSCSIRLDQRSYFLFLNKNEVSILLKSERKRFPLIISDYHKQYFNSWKNTSADLCIYKDKVYLHIVFEKDIPDVKPSGKFLGIDRGIKNIAVSSDNKFYSGKDLNSTIIKFKSLRRRLQRKGTKSAKRHLKKVSGKEKRFRADINHQISKQILDNLNPGDTIILENLTGIRNNNLRKEQRSLLHNWSFYQLQEDLVYKGLAKNIVIEYINPKYTSQCCSVCGHIEKANRKGMSFCCKACGFKLNADLNASRNIRDKHVKAKGLNIGAVVNQPIVGANKLLTSCQL